MQPYSGSPANLAVYLAFVKPGDKVMGLALPMGGHLTHGWNVSITGKLLQPVQYGVRKDTGRIDYDEVRDLAQGAKPKSSAAAARRYPRIWTSRPSRRSPRRWAHASSPTSLTSPA